MGQIWNATSAEDLDSGEEIEVTATEGLRLHVARR
jgi:membrane protein implicated in regulation of membrane protease activity